MSEDPADRPSLRLIAGDLVSDLVHDVDAVAQLAGLGIWPRLPRQGSTPDDERIAGPDSQRRRVVVVGGGIAGLTVAWSLVRDRGSDAEVIIYEAGSDVGGKLKSANIEGITLDVGAESFQAARPEALALAKSIGLSQSIVNPATAPMELLSRGALRQQPKGLVGGIPTDLRALAASDVMSLSGLLRVPLDHLLPKTEIDGDVSVGDYVSARLGREAVDRLVEPVLSGVYAGRADELSLDMSVPALYRLAKRRRSLLAAAAEVRNTGAAPSGARRGPVSAGLSGGVARLPLMLADKLRKRGVDIRPESTVTGLRQSDQGWQLLVTNNDETYRVSADAVVLAVPTPAAARLLRQTNPQVATVLDTVDYASVATTTLLYLADSIPQLPATGGFLVPPVEGRSITAAYYLSNKWGWVSKASAQRGRGGTKRPGFFVVRTMAGRYGELEALQPDDQELAKLAATDLHEVAGLPRRPAVAQVSRWGGSLPQYTVGHRARMARVRELLVATPGLAVCGAAYDGVGVAACIGSAQVAAGQVSTYLAERRQLSNGR
ncbi:MAG: protoporphyrinogen oxidase [Actinomycetes bacterium]